MTADPVALLERERLVGMPRWQVMPPRPQPRIRDELADWRTYTEAEQLAAALPADPQAARHREVWR